MSTLLYRKLSLEELENTSLADSLSAPTGLVRKCIELSKLPLESLSPADLRVLISQQIGLPFLIPLALEILKQDPFIESEYYEGDLLNAVIMAEPIFWKKAQDSWNDVDEILRNNIDKITQTKINLSSFYEAN